MTLTPKKKDLAAEWREARLLYPLYSALAREFVIDLPACDDLEAGCDNPPQQSVEQAREWLLEMDQKIQVHQLRQFLQTTNLTSEEGLQTLLEHHLHRASRDWIRIVTRLIFCWSNIFRTALPLAWKMRTWIWLTWPRCWIRSWEAWT